VTGNASCGIQENNSRWDIRTDGSRKDHAKNDSFGVGLEGLLNSHALFKVCGILGLMEKVGHLRVDHGHLTEKVRDRGSRHDDRKFATMVLLAIVAEGDIVITTVGRRGE
jgi:hypothetical protein